MRRSQIDEHTLHAIAGAIERFHQERTIFITSGIRDNFCLPRQHSIVHYCHLIRQFGAPNGLCSSITESKHIKAVKEPWRRSSRFEALGQMLVTNQRLDKLAALRVILESRGLLDGLVRTEKPDAPKHDVDEANDEDIQDIEGLTSDGDVRLPRRAGVFLCFFLYFIFLLLHSKWLSENARKH